jgi:hypothetical protein
MARVDCWSFACVGPWRDDLGTVPWRGAEVGGRVVVLVALFCGVCCVESLTDRLVTCRSVEINGGDVECFASPSC